MVPVDVRRKNDYRPVCQCPHDVFDIGDAETRVDQGRSCGPFEEEYVDVLHVAGFGDGVGPVIDRPDLEPGALEEFLVVRHLTSDPEEAICINF